jgi:hypothetical protein
MPTQPARSSPTAWSGTRRPHLGAIPARNGVVHRWAVGEGVRSSVPTPAGSTADNLKALLEANRRVDDEGGHKPAAGVGVWPVGLTLAGGRQQAGATLCAAALLQEERLSASIDHRSRPSPDGGQWPEADVDVPSMLFVGEIGPSPKGEW